MEEATSRNWLTRGEAAAFIGNNTEYYLDQWKSHPNTFYKGWNWASAAFRVEWMAYRKMYMEAILCLITVTLLGIGIDMTLAFAGIDIPTEIFRLTLQILLGFFGNSLYRKKAIRVLRKTSHMENDERLKHMALKGGTSIIGLLVLLVMETAAIFVPSIITASR